MFSCDGVDRTKRGFEMSESMFIEAVSLARAGRKAEARKMFEQLLKADRTNEMAWLWYAECVETPAERVHALEACVRINPQAQRVRLSLTALQRTGLLSNDTGLTLPVVVGEEDEKPPKPPRNLTPEDQWVLSPDSGVFTISPEQISRDEFERVEKRTEAFLLKNPDLKPVWNAEDNREVEFAPRQKAPVSAPKRSEPTPQAMKSPRKSRGAIFTLLLITLMLALLVSAAIVFRVL